MLEVLPELIEEILFETFQNSSVHLQVVLLKLIIRVIGRSKPSSKRNNLIRYYFVYRYISKYQLNSLFFHSWRVLDVSVDRGNFFLIVGDIIL